MAANGCEKSARAEVAAALIKIALLWENSPTDPARPFVCEMSFVKESAKSRRACPSRYYIFQTCTNYKSPASAAAHLTIHSTFKIRRHFFESNEKYNFPSLTPTKIFILAPPPLTAESAIFLSLRGRATENKNSSESTALPYLARSSLASSLLYFLRMEYNATRLLQPFGN